MSNKLENFDKAQIGVDAKKVSFDIDEMFKPNNMDSNPEKLTIEDIKKYQALNEKFNQLIGSVHFKHCLEVHNVEKGKTSYLYPFIEKSDSQFPDLPILIVKYEDGTMEKYELTPDQYENVLNKAEELLQRQEPKKETVIPKESDNDGDGEKGKEEDHYGEDGKRRYHNRLPF